MGTKVTAIDDLCFNTEIVREHITHTCKFTMSEKETVRFQDVLARPTLYTESSHYANMDFKIVSDVQTISGSRH